VGSIILKELRGYFNTPIAYIVIIFVLEFTTIWFLYIQQFLYQNVASMGGFFGALPVIYIIALPALTMRAWAEERRQGTSEILLTLPISEGRLVAGKFLAALILLSLIALLTLPLPLTLSPLGRFQFGPIAGQYIGIILLGAAGIAIGQFISAFSSNQITSFLFSVVALLFITLVGQVNTIAQLPNWLASGINYFSLDYHFQSFDKGIIDTRDVIYFLVMTGFFLYLNTKVLVLRRWS